MQKTHLQSAKDGIACSELIYLHSKVGKPLQCCLYPHLWSFNHVNQVKLSSVMMLSIFVTL